MTDSPPIARPGDAPDPAGAPRGEVAGGAWRLALLAAAVVGVGVYAGKGWIFILVALTGMIFLHELGHFLTAKWTGMKVTEFFLGIGPKIWSFRRGETEYGVKLIPVAAYVRIVGMNNLDEVPAEDEPRTYRQQSFPKRMLVITAGSMMHFLQAFVLFVVLFTVIGVPRDSVLADDLGAAPPGWDVHALLPGGAAATAGIEPGDHIVEIDGHRVVDVDDVGALIRGRAGDALTVVVERDGARIPIPLTVGHADGKPDQGMLGVELGTEQLPGVTTSVANGIVQAGRNTGTWIGQTVGGLGGFVTGGIGHFADDVISAGREEDGPGPAVVGSGGSPSGSSSSSSNEDDRLLSIYGVARIGAHAGENSTSDFLMLLAFVNISIGVLNLVPLLPLDGGHAAIAIYERIRSRRGRRHMADVSRLLPLTYAVVLVLSVIMVSSVYLDIVDPIGVG